MASFTSGYQRTPGGWDWPSDLPGDSSHAHNARTPSPSPKQRSPQAADPAKPKKKRTWGPRVCRICLETVLPTFHEPSEHLPDLLQGAPRVSYDSDGGRLLRPCKCKGSAAYVHETCLQEWRYADPSYGKRNYWNCPTCGFQYRLGRMSWAHWVSSTATQIALTTLIFAVAVFALGFVADPIINMYLDPVSTIALLPSPYEPSHFEHVPFVEDDESGWVEHFAKGFASLGLLGFVKVIFTLGPWNWFNIRQFLGGGRAANTGRDRMANVTWVVIVLGVCTFLYTVWKVVRAWSRRVLEKASDKVMDVQGDDDDDDDDDADDSR